MELYQQQAQMHAYLCVCTCTCTHMCIYAHKSIPIYVDIYTETHTLCGEYVLYVNMSFLMEILFYHYRTEIGIALAGIFLVRK